MVNDLEDRGAWTLENCSVANALDVIGNRISLLLLREAFLGTRRFDDFAARVEVSEPAAAKRLGELTAAGLLERVRYQEPGQRTRFEYRLTDKGRDLLPVVTALRDWGDRWASGPEGPPFRALHKSCGTTVRAEVRCERGHRVGRGEIRLERTATSQESQGR